MAEIKEAMPAPQPEALDMPDDEVLYELADLFRVFGDSTRIKILYALHDNELCVQDIANAVQLSQSAVSHQLRVLKDSKLVRFRREGKTVYYALDDDHVDISGAALGQEALKPVPAVLGARERFIGVDPAVKPASVLLDQRTVVAHLCRQRMQHGILPGGNSGIGCDPL